MKVYELEKVFYALCESKSKELNVLHTEYNNNLKQSVYIMTLDKVKIEIIYHKKKSIFIPISTLYCKLYLDRESDIYFHLTELIGYLNNQDFRCCYFPYIENVYRMNACFQQLFDILDDYIFYVSNMDRNEKNRIYECQKQFLVEAFNIDEENYDGEFERKFYDKNYYPYHFTNFDGYIDYLDNNYLKSIEKYEKILKKDILCPYEIQLMEYMRNHSSFPCIPDDCNSRKEIEPYIKGGKKDLVELLTCMLPITLLFILFSIICLIIYKNLVIQDCIAFYGCDWYWGFLIGALPGLFGGIVFRKTILKIFKKFKYLEYDDLINGNFVNKLSILVFVLSIGLSIFITSVVMTDITRFYDNHFDVAGEDLFSHVVYKYEDIEDIYYMKARYNEYGDRVERSSYVIHMKNDEYVDLDLVLSDEEMKEIVLPLLNHEVKIVDSEKELEFYK